MGYSRQENTRTRVSNSVIEAYIATHYSTYTIIDILGATHITVILRCSKGYEYAPLYGSLLLQKTPAFRLTDHNIKQVCENAGVTYISDATSRVVSATFKINYTHEGASYCKNLMYIKLHGHTTTRSESNRATLMKAIATCSTLALKYISSCNSMITVEDSRGLQYTSNMLRFIAGVKPTRWINERNLRHLITNIGGEYLHHTPILVTYMKGGLEFTINIMTLKTKGHMNTPYTITRELLEHKALKHNCKIISIEGKRVDYLCARGHTASIRTKGFMRKVDGMCKTCSPKMQYTNSTIDNFDNTDGVLYIVQMSKGDEQFTKVGITKQKRAHQRFSPSNTKGYAVKVIKEYPMQISVAYSIEQKVLLTYKDYKYIPLTHFVGWTECLITTPSELSWFIEKEIKNANI